MEPCVAHVDEAGARLADGRHLYVLAAVLTSPADRSRIVQQLTALQEGGLPLHYYGERPERRLHIAES